MTHDRTDAITDQFEAWLSGYTPPRSMQSDIDRQSAEKLSLLRIVLKFSPETEYQRFIAEALDECAMQMKTRAWPTQNELGAAFRNHRKERHNANGSKHSAPWAPDAAQINADRMRSGKAVGEGWLYGALACEMIARGLIDEETMKRYRSAAFFNRRSVYGEAQARTWEDEAKSSHDAAKEVWRRRNDRKSRDTGDLAALVKYPGAEHVAF